MGKLKHRYEIRIEDKHLEAIKKLKDNGDDVAELLREYLLKLATPKSIEKRKKRLKEKIKTNKTKAQEKELKDKILRKELKIKAINSELEIIRQALKNFQDRTAPGERGTEKYIHQIQNFKDSLDSLKRGKENLKKEVEEMKKTF